MCMYVCVCACVCVCVCYCYCYCSRGDGVCFSAYIFLSKGVSPLRFLTEGKRKVGEEGKSEKGRKYLISA